MSKNVFGENPDELYEGMKRFAELRERLFRMIGEALKRDEWCKPYEGGLALTVWWPDYFEDREAEKGPVSVSVKLDCYVLGPHRHYEFPGRTLSEALDEFSYALSDWEEELTEEQP